MLIRLIWSEARTGEVGPNVGGLHIKARFTGTAGATNDRFNIYIEDSTGKIIYLFFAVGYDISGWEDGYSIDDNDGLPQTIDLASKGLSGRIVDVRFEACHEASNMSLTTDYLTFLDAS